MSCKKVLTRILKELRQFLKLVEPVFIKLLLTIMTPETNFAKKCGDRLLNHSMDVLLLTAFLQEKEHWVGIRKKMSNGVEMELYQALSICSNMLLTKTQRGSFMKPLIYIYLLLTDFSDTITDWKQKESWSPFLLVKLVSYKLKEMQPLLWKHWV